MIGQELPKEGEYWRVYLLIEDATCYDQVQNDEDFYQSAFVFGNFQVYSSDSHTSYWLPFIPRYSQHHCQAYDDGDTNQPQRITHLISQGSVKILSQIHFIRQ